MEPSGLIPEALDDGIVTNEFPAFAVKTTDCNPSLLVALLTCEQFYGQIEAKVSGASGRRRMEPEELLDMQIPLPRIERHDAIAGEFGKLSCKSMPIISSRHGMLTCSCRSMENPCCWGTR